MFDKLIEQVSYAIEQLPEMVAKNTISIQVNGINKNSLVEYGGWIQQLINAPVMDMDPINGTLEPNQLNTDTKPHAPIKMYIKFAKS